MLTAITRALSPAIVDCELSFLERQPIDFALAVRQHAAYEDALRALGTRVISLPCLPSHPDCVFVEDPAIVLDEVAIMTRMGAESRRGESESLAAELGKYRELRWIEAPACLEGGDVIRVGKTLYVGLSRRTNVAGIQQLAGLVQPFGYWVTPIEVRGCLHLKSACCYLGDDTLLANRQFLDTDGLCGLNIIDVATSEPHAANALRIAGTVLIPESYGETRERVGSAGFQVRAVDTSELIKAEAGVTCCSLVFEAD
ncbi:MAG: arginine deiminase family protein [Acidobacteriota bacterium]